MGKGRAAVVIVVAGLALATGASCLDPTEITLDVSTDLPCGDTKGVTFVGGGAGSVESATPSATSARCVGAGDLGTLVATPPGGNATDAYFVVVLGVDRPARECTAANHYKGCTVQRRAVSYVKHKPITLPVKMWLICKDVECDAESTCARNGKCVPARIPDPEKCASSPCFPAGDEPGVVDAGDPGDARQGDDGATDAASGTDAETGAGTDAGFEVTAVPPIGHIYCPPVAAGCDLGTPCCWKQSGGGGRCDGAGCDFATEYAFRCARRVDCGPGGTSYCCGVHSGDAGGSTIFASTCVSGGAQTCQTWLCLDDTDCPSQAPFCHRDSTAFTPTGIYGECQGATVVVK